MMIFSSLPPVIEIVTVAGAIGVAFISVVLLLFYCAPTWRKTKEEGKFEGIECEHEHQWTKASTEPGTSTQRIAYYGTLSLSAQNSPTRHLRSISATNPSTHFLSPSHMRSPRRNSSPVAQNQIQIGVPSNRTLSPHVLDLNSYPVQPPYWDPESQQYFHCYSYDSTHASPIRTTSSRKSSRSPMRPPTNIMTTSSPAILKRSSPPNPHGPPNSLIGSVEAQHQQRTPKKAMIDYSNLFLPQPPAPMKNTLIESFNSPQNRPDTFKHGSGSQDSEDGKRPLKSEDVDEEELLEREKEDILQIEHQQTDEEEKFEVILKKKQKMTIPKICSTPPDDEEEIKDVVSRVIEGEGEGRKEIQIAMEEGEEGREEKHVTEVN